MLINRFPEQEHYHVHWDHKFDGLSLLFASNSVRNIAITFLTFFSPLYIWHTLDNLGFPSRLSSALTVGYFLLVFLAKLFILPLAEKIGLRFGFKTNMYISTIPFLLTILLHLLARDHVWFLIFSAISWGIYIGFFWWGYHGFFIESGIKSFGRAIGVANILATVINIISPILGALIVKVFGFNFLFVAAGLTFVLGIMLLIPAKEHKPRVETSTSEVLHLFKKHTRRALAYFGYAAESSTVASVWPLFLFLTLGTALKVGEIASGAALVAAFLTFGIGFLLDKHWRSAKRDLIAVGVPLTSLTWIVRAFLTTAPPLIFIDATYKFVEQLSSLPLEVWAYKKGREGSVDRAMLFRQYAITLGASFITLIFMVWIILGGALKYTFLIASIFALFPLLVVKRR